MLLVTIRHVKYISELLQIISYYPDLHWDNEFQMDILDICFSPIKMSIQIDLLVLQK